MSNLRWPVVLFDLDGTLVNTVPLIVSSFQHTWREGLGRELDAAVAMSWIGRTLPDIFAPFGPDKAADLRALYVEYNLAELPRRQLAYEGIHEMLDGLEDAGAVVGIVTSKARPAARLSVEVGLLDGVPLLAALEDTTEHKPGPEPLLHALAFLGREPSDVVYVGDAVVDIQAARAAGTAAVAVTWGAGASDDLRAERPDAVADSADQLLAILTGGNRT